MAPLADRVYGNDQRRKLSPAAIEVLSIVAYRPGITAKQISQLRRARSNQTLAKLVRWRLLSVVRTSEAPREAAYQTTDRLERLLGIATLDDLPRPEALEDCETSVVPVSNALTDSEAPA